MNVRIDGEARHTKGLRHDDLCGFVANPGKSFQGIQIGRNVSLVFIEQDVRELVNRFRLLRTKSAWLHDSLDFSDGSLGQLLGGVTQLRKKLGGNLIHPHVSALCRKQNSNQKREWIFVIQRNRRMRIQLRKSLQNVFGSLGFGHDALAAAMNSRHHAAHMIIGLSIPKNGDTLGERAPLQHSDVHVSYPPGVHMGFARLVDVDGVGPDQG